MTILAGMVALTLLIGGVWVYRLYFAEEEDPGHEARVKTIRACDVPVGILEKVWRGYVPKRSGDVLAVEQEPHQFGTRHSSPYPYTQDVPVVFYGPGFIKQGASSDPAVTVADMAPTLAELLKFDEFPEREGRVLDEVLLPENERNGVPKLIFNVVWDGGGDNVLEQWPDQWPELKELMAAGFNFENATVGSTPSITPSIHATMGTGAFPKTHGLPDVKMRVNGKIIDAYQGHSPKYLRSKTLGDLWDQANGNEPIVGMMARDAWHLGMIGHGAYIAGGDHDIAIMDDLGDVEFRTAPDYYSLPEYVLGLEGLDEAIAEVDQRDGQADQSWLGNPILPFDGRIRYTPAWSIFQTQKLFEVMENEALGADDIPDLFYVNYKSTDLVGHEYNMVEDEERDVVKEQDVALGQIVDKLDELVGPKNYVLTMTADHGMAPYPEVTGGWSIEMSDLSEDIEKRFDKTTPNKPIILSNRGYQVMLNKKELERNDITSGDIAAYIRDYRIRDNITDTNTVLERFEGKTDERLFLTALTPSALKKALDCAREL